MLMEIYRVLRPGKKAAVSVVGPRSNEFTWLDGIFERNKSVGRYRRGDEIWEITFKVEAIITQSWVCKDGVLERRYRR